MSTVCQLTTRCIIRKVAGLPNLTGSAGSTRYYSYSETDRSDKVTGVYSGATTGLDNNYENGGADNFTCSLAFNASYSNSIYGKSTTVTPLSLSYLPVIKY